MGNGMVPFRKSFLRSVIMGGVPIRTGHLRGCVMNARLKTGRGVIIHGLVTRFAATGSGPRQRHRIEVPPFPHGHRSGRGGARASAFSDVLILFFEIRGLVLEIFLQPPAQSPFGLGHGRDGVEFFQKGVPPEGSLYRECGCPRFFPAVFSLEHFDLFVEEILGQFVPEKRQNLR